MGTETDLQKELVGRISKNLSYIIENSGISQTELIKKIKRNRNYTISQPYLSKIINGNLNSIPCLPLVTICEALNVNIQEVFWENMDQSSLVEQINKGKDNKLVYVSKDKDFDKYLGKYHCYFYPTISDETNKEILYGELNFYLHENTKECLASFILYVMQEEIQKKEYHGKLIYSKEYNCLYCYLVNEEYGEINFLMFKGISSNIKRLSCRMVAVLTPAAGGTRDATSHRMFITRRKLSEKGIAVISPHLKMNTSEIIISEKELDNFCEELNVPEKFKNILYSLVEPDKLLVLREEFFWGFTTQNVSGYNKFKYITELRKRSRAKNYYKIGMKVEDILYKYLYKSANKVDFFDKDN